MTYPIDVNVTSYLDAVNRLITSVGSDPVTDADPSLDADVAIAVTLLQIKNMEVQSQGWAWNTDEKFPLQLNSDGTVSVPANCLSVVAAYWADTGAPMLVTQRGNLLYDQVNHTTNFIQPNTTPPTSIQVDLITRLDWDEMIQPMRNVITAEACFEFQAGKQGAPIVAQVNQRDISRAWSFLEAAESRARPANQIGGNLSVMRNLYGSGVRRNRGVF